MKVAEITVIKSIYNTLKVKQPREKKNFLSLAGQGFVVVQ